MVSRLARTRRFRASQALSQPPASAPLLPQAALAVPTTQALLPYMDEYWRDQLSAVIVGVEGGIARMELNSYPPNAPLSARPDWRPDEGRAGAVRGLAGH